MYRRLRELLVSYPDYVIRRIRFESVYTQILIGFFVGLFSAVIIYMGAVYVRSLRLVSEPTGIDSAGILKEASDEKLYILHPLPVNVTRLDRVVKYWLYRTPLSILPDGTFTGDLVSAWEVSSDGKVFTFYLVKDAKWSNGKPITADDVLFTIERIRDGFPELPIGQLFKDAQLVKQGDYKFQIRLKQPYAPFLEAMTFPVMSKEYYSRFTVDQLIYEGSIIPPVTSAGYVLDRLSPEQVTLKRIYVNGRNKYSSIVYKLYHNQVWKSLVAGEAYGSDTISDSDYLKLRRIPFIGRQRFIRMYNFVGIFFNLNSENIWVKNQKFRQWLYTAIDRQKISNKGFGVPAFSVYPEGSVYYHLELVRRFTGAKVDFDKLKTRILSENECFEKGGTIKAKCLVIDLVIRDRQVDRNIAEYLRELLGEYGIDLKVSVASDEELNSTILPLRRFDVLVFEIETTPDPDQYLFWHSSQVEYPGLNISGLKSRRMDRALLRGRVLLDREERKTIYREMQEILFEFMPFIPVLQPYYDYVYRTDRLTFEEAEEIIYPEHRYLYLVPISLSGMLPAE